jgi:predicted DCC family thiol-disulfide oxidoreductase YuxK
MKALEFIDGWIFKAYGPCARSLPLFRIFFALYLLVFYLPRYPWVAEMPDSFFHPPVSLAMFFTALPPWWFFYLLDFLLKVGALCLLFGRQTRFISFAMCIGLIIGNSFRYSIGPKIDHDIFIPATLFCLGFSGWGNSLSQDEQHLSQSERRSSSSWPITLLMLMVSVCMLTAAIPKATSGWLSPHVYACRGQIISNYLQNFRPMPLADWLFRIHSFLFWKLADWSTLAIEGGFIFCVISLPSMRFIATMAVFFHAFVYFSMDIFFSINLAVYASLLDFRMGLRKSWIRHSLRRFRLLAHRVRLFHIVLLAIALLGFSYALYFSDVDASRLPNNLFIIAAVVIALVSLLHFLGALTDRLVFGIAFPLRADHSLVILYDGECGLCDKWVQFVLNYDHRGIFRFTPLQSFRGKELLRQAGSTESDLSSMILLIDNRTYLRSTAVLMILRQLGGFWALLGIFALVPVALRDFAYSMVATNRHRWFPRTGDSCRLLRPYERERFLS